MTKRALVALVPEPRLPWPLSPTLSCLGDGHFRSRANLWPKSTGPKPVAPHLPLPHIVLRMLQVPRQHINALPPTCPHDRNGVVPRR